jgi:hypothetical protein
MPEPTSTVTLRSIDDGNVRDIIGLSVSSQQENLAAPNAVSMAEAFARTKVWVPAIYADDRPVGHMR